VTARGSDWEGAGSVVDDSNSDNPSLIRRWSFNACGESASGLESRSLLDTWNSAVGLKVNECLFCGVTEDWLLLRGVRR
jgi:hypothetical protein